WSANIFVTVDSTRIIQNTSGTEDIDSFMRPVRWILHFLAPNTKGSQIVLIMSPYEVKHLLPSIRSSKHVTLHLYAPRLVVHDTPLVLLEFCVIPTVWASSAFPLDIMKLNLFAGQFYIRSYEHYTRLYDFLGLAYQHEGDEVEMSWDEFILPSREHLMATYHSCDFTRTPTDFARAVVVIRRKGHNFEVSHESILRLLAPVSHC
ncbi:hypothetical protein BJ878DRAFT_428669, partial [Calycina marina]